MPAPRWEAGDPRTYTLAERAAAWRNALDATVLVGGADRCRPSATTCARAARSSAWSPKNPRDGSADAAIKAALSKWTAGQATHFGTRGITVNVVAAGRGHRAGYDGLTSTPPSVAARDRPAGAVPHDAGRPPHHRPDAARQQRRAAPLRLTIIPGSRGAKRGYGSV